MRFALSHFVVYIFLHISQQVRLERRSTQLSLAMDPAPQLSLPSQHKFSWGAMSPPRTDSKGDQEEYKNTVRLWPKVQKTIPDSNRNKILSALHAVCLKTQLYGRAKSICSGISDKQLKSGGAVDLIADKISYFDMISTQRNGSF